MLHSGWLPHRSSAVPRRVKMRSAGEMRAAAAGTKQPIWARMTAVQVARSRVDFPPMFGPVSSRARGYAFSLILP